jgi:hypothetical protein
MKFFVDSVDPSEIRTCDEQGIIDVRQIIEQRR